MGQHRARPGEENNNDMADSTRKSRSLPNISKPLVRAAWTEEEKFTRETSKDEAKLLNLYMRGRSDRNSWNGEGYPAYWEDGGRVPPDEACRATSQQQAQLACSPTTALHNMANMTTMNAMGTKDKDAINEYLRKSRLTIIDEHTEGSSSSTDEMTVRPVPTPRQRSVTSMSTTPSQGTSLQSATPPLSSNSQSLQSGPGGSGGAAGLQQSGRPGHPLSHQQPGGAGGLTGSTALTKQKSANFPDLDFLEDDCALWDAFFTNKRTGGRHSSVLSAGAAGLALPVEDYLRRTGSASVRDVKSLRVLLPQSQQHLLTHTHSKSPITQVCESLSRLNSSQYSCEKELKGSCSQPVEIVKVKEAWAPEPEHIQGYFTHWDRRGTSREDLNLLNNNEDQRGRRTERRASTKPTPTNTTPDRRESSGNRRQRAVSAPRRPPARDSNSGGSQRSTAEEKAVKRRSYHPQDGLSQLLLSPSDKSARTNQSFPKSGSQGNLCDSWLDENQSEDGQMRITRSGNKKDRSLSAEYPFIPTLSFPNQNINFDLTQKRGLFVNLYTSVERLLLFQDPSPSYSNRSAARCVLLHEFCPALHAVLEDGLKEEVITSFGRMKTSVWRVIEAVMQAGPAQRATCDLVMLLNTKFSSEEDFKKFSGFIIGLLNMSSLHLWFSKLKWSMDVLVRFYERHAFICALHKETKLLFDELIFCLQRLFSLPFHLDMPFNSGILEEIPGGEMYKKREHCANCACSRTPSQNSSAPTTPGSSGTSSRTSRTSRSRIPRPISLPKRLEEKLSSSSAAAMRNSPARASSQGKAVTAAGQGHHTSSVSDPGSRLRSPLKPAVPPPRPKSRVRDTIKLFDAKYKTGHRGANAGSGRPTPVRPRSMAMTSPKTGGGEGMAGDSMEDKFK